MVNYTDLTTRIKNWLEDDYPEFAGDTDTMIENAENRISRDINMDAMIDQVSGAFVIGSSTHPQDADIVSVRNFRVTINGEIKPLFRRQTSYLLDYWPNLAKTAPPQFYANYDEEQWLIIPPPDQAYSYIVEGEKRIIGIKNQTTTWIGDNWPDLLFYASCMEGNVFDQDSEDATSYAALYKNALESAKREVARVRSDRNDQRAG